MAKHKSTLSAKHYKALELFEEGLLSIKEIAKACGFGESDMYKLFEGNIQKMGETAALFKEEVAKITQRTVAQTRDITKDCKKLAMYALNDRLRELKQMKPSKSVTDEITRIMNSLAKSTPNVEISSFSVSKGLTAEELRHEFTRLSAIARNASLTGRFPTFEPGEPGEIPGTTESGDTVPEE